MDIGKLNQQEMLEIVDKAIVSIAVGGQSYKIGSRQLTRGDLKTLYDIKNDLTAQIQSQGSSSLFDDTFVAYFDGR
ncbi:MAG: peptidylprolyl isomerase [Oscillospiraceae bacterium]